MKALLIFGGIMLSLWLFILWTQFTISLGDWGIFIFISPIIALISVGIAYSCDEENK